jgi:hypothetical protein
MSVTLLDPQADTTNEQAILEPGVGETPLWADCLVVALFADDVLREPLLAALESIDPRADSVMRFSGSLPRVSHRAHPALPRAMANGLGRTAQPRSDEDSWGSKAHQS